MTTVMSMSGAPPQKVPGYEVGPELGRGGSGVVFAARRLSDGADVAIKIVTGLARTLEAEARRAAHVRHPGVLPVLEVGSSGDAVWLVMPLVEGRDLQFLIDDRGSLPVEQAVNLMTQISSAVAAVHAAGLVHCDLKPANVLLGSGPDGLRAQVSDFGIATRRNTSTTSMKDDELLTSQPLTGDLNWSRTSATGGPADSPRAAGTFGYMSPEQWRGETPTPASDVYALGATLFAVLTGRRPFEHRSLPELAYAVAVAPAPRPSDHGAPARFDAVVARAMAKNPKDRYPTPQAFAHALTNPANGLPGATAAALAEGGPRRRGAWAGTRLASSLIMVVILAGATAVFLVGRHHDQSRAATAPSTTMARVVCARDLSLRDRPGGGGVLAQQLERGDRVLVDRSRDQGAYSFVTTQDGRRGWVLNQFLRDRCS